MNEKASNKPVRHVLALFGGKDSSALAAFMRDKVPDMEYAFCDMGEEIRYALRIKLSDSEIDETEVKYSVMSECERLFATKLMPYMPTRAELEMEIERSRMRAAARSSRKRTTRAVVPVVKGAPS